MSTHSILLDGPGARGPQVNARALRDLLDMVVAGSEKALRLLTQGRSQAWGPTLAWISSATEYVAQIEAGCTRVILEAPTLGDSAPQLFEQAQLIDAAVDPDMSAYDCFMRTMGSALHDEEDARYDRGFLQWLANFDQLFKHGIVEITFDSVPERTQHPIKLTRDSLAQLGELAARMPDPRQARIAGKLDTISHQARTFVLKLMTDKTGESVRGIVPTELRDELSRYWGQAVIVSGTVFFTSRGKVQRLEAEHIAPADEQALAFWQQIPMPIGTATTDLRELRRPQGPGSGLNAIFGQWPGDESDEELIAALDKLS